MQNSILDLGKISFPNRSKLQEIEKVCFRNQIQIMIKKLNKIDLNHKIDQEVQ